MTLIRLFSSFFAVLLLFSSCAADEDALLGFRNTPSSFVIRFSSSAGDVVCRAEMNSSPDKPGLRLVIKEPERSAGISVFCGYDSCTVEADGTEIPLSEDASGAVRDIFLILSSEVPGNLPVRSDDGGRTLLESERGTLVLDENLLPCAVEYAGMDGEMRTAVIEDFSSINTDNREHSAD